MVEMVQLLLSSSSSSSPLSSYDATTLLSLNSTLLMCFTNYFYSSLPSKIRIGCLIRKGDKGQEYIIGKIQGFTLQCNKQRSFPISQRKLQIFFDKPTNQKVLDQSSKKCGQIQINHNVMDQFALLADQCETPKFIFLKRKVIYIGLVECGTYPTQPKTLYIC